ncbi:HYR domain-containing protein [Candidatus Nitrosopelagicus sp.]|nr:HYR domain-containing protein [Candidatus Nitrosopelagicus sp.]
MAIPIFEMKLSKQPIAVMKAGDKQLKFIKMRIYNTKYWASKEHGIFEVDDTYEYRFKNTSVYFYNASNPKPLSLKAMDEIDTALKNSGDVELVNQERIINVLGSNPEIDPTNLQIPPDKTREFTPLTRRFLHDYQRDDERKKVEMIIKVPHQKTHVESLSGLLIGMGMNRGHFAFVQIGHKTIDIVPMYLHNDRAFTRYGVFEYTKDNLYLCKKQQIGLFVLNDTEHLPSEQNPKKVDKVMTKMVRRKEWDKLESFVQPVNSKKKPLPLNKNVSISSEKNLVQWQADQPSIMMTTLKEVHSSKIAIVTGLGESMKKAMPIVMIFGGIMLVAIVMSNLPPVIDKLAEYTGAQPPQIVFLSPQEAKDQGLTVGDLPVATQVPTTQKQYDQMVAEGLAEGDMTAKFLEPVETEGDYLAGDFQDSKMILPTDTVPPEITYQDILVTDVTTNGAMVKYAEYGIIAFDDVDGQVEVICDPPNRKIFPLGDSPVVCFATDEAGNSSRVEFTVTVEAREREQADTIGGVIPAPPNLLPP